MRTRSGAWLADRLCAANARAIILDCRDPCDFSKSHVKESINVCLPSLLLRRLQRGTLSPMTAISRKGHGYASQVYRTTPLVLISGNSPSPLLSTDPDLCTALYRTLDSESCEVYILEDGYSAFEEAHPALCYQPTSETEVPLLGLESLRINGPPSPVSDPEPPGKILPKMLTLSVDTLSDCCSNSGSSRTSPSDVTERGEERPRSGDVPVQILPYLYLGNFQNASDMNVLQANNIHYVINVTLDLPNVFETDGTVHYLRIPISDHWSQNLSQYFTKAIDFIEQARSEGKGVLVHCLAGISRSVTVTVAYLMSSLSLTMDEAFDRVRAVKPDVSPNFTFMNQLLDFQYQMDDSGRSSSSSSPNHGSE